MLRALINNGEHFTGGCEKGGAVLFTSKSLLAQYRPVRLHVTVFKEHGPVNFTSGSFGAVFVNLLFAQYRVGWMHLLATANYARVMCLKNCLCLLPTGSFQGRSEKRWLFFVVNEGCGAAFTSKPLPAQHQRRVQV